MLVKRYVSVCNRFVNFIEKSTDSSGFFLVELSFEAFVMDTERDIVRIEKLQDASQFTTWKFQVRVALNARDIYAVVSGDEVKPDPAAEGATAAASSTASTAIATWNRRDAKAQNIIVSSLGERVISHVIDCETSRAMWLKLISIYEQSNEFSKSQLQQQFFSYAKEPADDMATYISKMEVLVHRMRNANVAIDDSMIITKLLTALPQEYRHFASAWDSFAPTSQTLITLKSRLMIEEQRMKTNDSAEKAVAFVAKGGSKQKQKAGKCFSCGRKGHWKSQCPEKSSSEAKSTEEKTFFARGDVAFICVDVHDRESIDAFVLDSAATKHMCKKREWFNDYIELKRPEHITIGNGEKIQAIGRGNIGVKSFDGKQWIDATLYNVLYVPKLHRNLFSSIKATDKGCKIHSDNRKCEVVKGGSIVAVGVRNSGLYYMQFKVKQPEKPRQFAVIEIESSVLVESNKAASENIESNSIVVDKSNEHNHTRNDDTSKLSTSAAVSIEPHDEAIKSDDASSTYTTASQSSTYNTASDDDSKESDDKQTNKQQQSVLPEQHKQSVSSGSKKILDRRKSIVCDVMQENVIDSRLRKPQATIHEKRKESDEKDDNGDTAFIAIVDESKTKKKKHKE